MSPTLGTHIERVWRRRRMVIAITLVCAVGSVIASLGNQTTYTGRALLSASTQTRAPEQDAILAQGYSFYFNDPSYQEVVRERSGIPDDVTSFVAQFVSAGPLLYVQATATDAEVAREAAGKLAQTFIGEINGHLDASRQQTIDDMTTAFDKVWGPKLAADDPEADTALLQLQKEIDDLNGNQTNRLTILQTDSGTVAMPASKVIPLASGVVGGLVLGCVVALLLGARTRRLYTEADVAEKTGVRVLETIPVGGGGVDEERRQVRLRHLANIVAKSSAQSPAVVAVCPTTPGTVGSEVAFAIAQQRAIQGVHTVFVRANLRDGAQDGPGVAEFLSTPGALHVQRAAGPAELDIVSQGETTGDPYGLFDRERVRELIGQAGDNADLVVVEAPPIASAAEGQVICDVADRTLLVLEAGRTTVEDVAEAIRVLEQMGGDVIGAVLVERTPHPADHSRHRVGAGATETVRAADVRSAR
ncbi:hypothetical protein [Antrihabitans spumae]|uniref:Polysaccharide chain length determinant N-terminal domain-containing protein n=1 Tax=Antrihabitans spumae TaxID=3373370 RepID=A0ABW7KMG9_9NOCA